MSREDDIMRVLCALCGLFLAVAIVNCSPIVKRETDEELDPLNQVSTLFLSSKIIRGANKIYNRDVTYVELNVDRSLIDPAGGEKYQTLKHSL